MTGATQVKDILRQVQSGYRDAAVTGIAGLIRSEAQIADLWLHVARAALAVGELSLAEAAARYYLVVDKAQVQRVLQTAAVLAEAGKFEKALKLLRPRLKRNPRDASLNHLCGTIYQQLGEPKRAAKLLRTTLRSANLAGATWLTLAAQHNFRKGDALFERLLGLGSSFAATDTVNRMQYHFTVGKALLDKRQYEPAFDAFSDGARLAPDARRYDAQQESQRVDAIIARNDATAISATANQAQHKNRAIFVVGLPRTGTTLLQRILTAHKAVSDGGEFSGMGAATMDLRRLSLDSCEQLSEQVDGGAAELGDVAETYLHLASERFGSKGLIVDKSINNSYYVGIIAKAFPAAPIIVLERDVLDVAWSCFRTCFSQGLQWSWSLEDIAAHFKAEERLMRHWKNVLSDRITVVRYEDLVREPEQVIPDLLQYCGLEFEQNIYRFYQKRSAVTTSSVAQVNQPLNDRSVGSAQRVIARMQPFVDAYSN